MEGGSTDGVRRVTGGSLFRDCPSHSESREGPSPVTGRGARIKARKGPRSGGARAGNGTVDHHARRRLGLLLFLLLLLLLIIIIIIIISIK